MRGWILGVAAAAALVVVCLAVWKPAPSTCGQGRLEDPARTDRLLSLLATTEARALLQRAPRPLRVCYGNVPASTLSTDDVYTLDQGGSEGELAARLGHLLLHAVEGEPLPESIDRSRSCDEVVAAALEAEARAHSLEQRLRRALKVAGAFAFKRDYWASNFARRCEALRRR